MYGGKKLKKGIYMLIKFILKVRMTVLIVLILILATSCNDDTIDRTQQHIDKSSDIAIDAKTVTTESSFNIKISSKDKESNTIKPLISTNASAKVNVEVEKKSVSDKINMPHKKVEIENIQEDNVELIRLYKNNDSLYTITCRLPDGNTLINLFTKKEWGTWNIGSWYAVKGDTNIPDENGFLAGGGSDFEYVFRVADGDGRSYKLSGGNHGSEKLVNIELVNDKNSKINLKSGGKLELNSFRIIENTELYFDSSYSKKYAAVHREYTFSPLQIEMVSDFEFNTDVNLATSYVCMFPVSKRFGRYARFNDTGYLYTTPESGKTLTTGNFENYLGMDKTLSVDIWGDENPKYVFNVSIGNEDMVDYFRNKLKVFFWDGNVGENKLYFSKYDLDELTKIPAGTKWHNTAAWKLIVKP